MLINEDMLDVLILNEDVLAHALVTSQIRPAHNHLHLYNINHPTSHPDTHEDKTQQEGEGPGLVMPTNVEVY